MANLIGRSVTLLRIHDVIHVDGVGQVGPVIDTAPGKNKGNSRLEYLEQGILLTGTGAKGTFEVIIPHSMCKSIQLKVEKA
jgi:hypothetical protein